MRPLAFADCTGFHMVDASTDGEDGSLFVRTDGRFDGGEATGSWDTVAGSGTGCLADLRGLGRFRAPPGSTATIELDG